MLSFFVYLVTAILCFYLGRREKDKQLQAVIRERDNWRLMFNTLAAEHKETLETVREQQISLSMKEKSRKEQNEEILALKRKLRGQNTDKERKQIYECLYGLRRAIRHKESRRYSPCVRLILQKIQNHLYELISLQEHITMRIHQFQHLDASVDYDQIFEERKQYQKKLMKQLNAEELYINWNDEKINRYSNAAFDLQNCHNYLSILFRSIDSMNVVILPDKCKLMLSDEKC